MKNTIFRVMGPALILAALLAAACGNIFDEPVKSAEAAAGKGIARISIGGETAGGRTLMPDHLALYYVLEFTGDGGTREAYISDGTPAEVELDEGTWDLTVKGYPSQEDAVNNPEYPAITGEAESGPVEIKSGEKTEVKVILSPVQTGEGQGSLSYDLKFPGAMAQATLYVEPFVPDGNAAVTVDLLTGATDIADGKKRSADQLDGFNAGYYRLRYTLVTDGGLVLKRSTVVHIYDNMVTPLEGEFGEGDFTEAFVAADAITYIAPADLLDGDEVDLTTAEVTPADATNQDIVWSLSPDDDGSTGITAETLAGGDIRPGAGTLKLTATVRGGAGNGTDTTGEFTITIAQRPKAAVPEANPAGGAVAFGAQVTLATATAEADIYYTLDGNMPDKNNPAQKYTAAITLNVAGTVTLKAIAVKEPWTDSGVLTAVYTVAPKDPGKAGVTLVDPFTEPTSLAAFTLKRAAGDANEEHKLTLDVDVAAQIAWYVDTVSRGSSAELTLSAWDYTPGKHYVSVEFSIDGKAYDANLVFTVEAAGSAGGGA